MVSVFHGSAAFVGRALELSVLRDAWTSVSGGRPCWVCVEGEAGIGKTRLVAEFAREVSADGSDVLVGNCPPVAPGLVPFAPIADVLRKLGPSAADGLALRHAEAIARLVDVDLPAGPSRMPGEGDRGHLFVAVRAVLERLCGNGPLLAVLEDLHWADASTRELLAFLASQPPRGPVMFVATYRDDEPAAGQPVWSLVDRLYRTGGRRLDLPRFSRDELAGLLDGLIGHRPEDDMIEAVLARSEGNPFLAEELVAADAHAGVLPEGLRNLLLARTAELSPAARQVVGLAAVAGVAIDDELLQQAGLSTFGDKTELSDAIRRAVAAGVLLGVPGQPRYAFRHALVRDAVYDDLLPTSRSRWHREIAGCLVRAIDRSRGAGHAELAARIAHHWLAAGDRSRALAAAIDAAEAAKQTLAFGEASRQYRTAVELWEELSASAAGISSLTLSELYDRAASASYMSGESDRAVTEVTRAIELTDREREPTRVGLMYERRAHYRFAAGHPYSDTLTDATTAVHLVPDEATPARALVLAAMGAELMYGHRFTDAIAVAERALILARSMGTAPKVVAHALSTLGISRAYSGDVAAGVDLAEESVRVAAQGDDTPYLYRSYTNLSCVLMLADLPRAAEVAIEGAKGACRDGLAGTYGNFLTGNAVDALLSIGEWAQADALLADGVSEAGADPISIANLVISSVLLAAWRDDRPAVARDLASIDASLSRGGHPDMRGRLAVAAAEATIWRRDYPAALRYISAAADAEADTDDIDMRPRVAATGLRLLADWPAGQSESGQQRDVLAERMLDLVTEANRHKPPGVESVAFLRTAEAEAARLAGTTDVAVWRSAIRAWERVPAPHRVGYARLRLAEALLAGKSERRQAEAELGAVLDVAERLGARALAEEAQCLAVRARLRPAVADPADPAGQLGLTRRERDVLKLVCAGRTNRQIAAQLFISPKTAELHVSHILAKLSVTTRGEAAAVAHRAGLDRGID